MPGPETAYRPNTHTKEREHSDTFTMPDITPPEEQQLDPYYDRDLDVIIPDDASMLDPETGEFLPAPDDASALDPVTGEVLNLPEPAATEDHEAGLPVPTGTGESPLDVPDIKVVIAGLDKNIEQFAREAALEKLERAKVRKGSIWKHMVKRVWHTLTHEYQLVKATKEAREEILANENLRHHQGADASDAAWREATIERMSSEYGEQLMREEAGESYKKLTVEDELDPESPESIVRLGILDLLRRYARDEFENRESFEAEFNEWMNMLRTAGVAQELLGEARLKASNMFAVAEQVRAAFDATDGLEEIDRTIFLESTLTNMEIVVGEAKVGSTVEIKGTTAEWLAEKMRGIPFVSEERLAGAASLLGNELFVAGVLSVLLAAGKKSTSFIPGLGAAVVAGFRARRQMLNDRAMMDRREDNGQTVNKKFKLQGELDEARYEVRSASDLLQEIGKLYNQEGELNLKDRAALEEAIRIHAEIDGRMELHFSGARLISFGSGEGREDARFDLEMALAKLKTDLERAFDNPVAVAMLDIEEDESLDAMLLTQKDLAIGAIEGGMKEKDKLLNKLVAKEVFKKMLITGLTAALMSEGLKHIASAIHEYIMELLQKDPNMALAAMEEYYQPGGQENVIENGPSGDLGGNGSPADSIGNNGGPADNLGGNGGPANDLGGNNNGPASNVGNNGSPADNLGNNGSPADNLGNNGGPADNLGNNGSPADTLGNNGGPADNLGGNGNGPASELGNNNGPASELGGNHGPSSELGNNNGPSSELGNNGESLKTHGVDISEHAKLNLPNGYNAETSGGHVNVTGPDGKTFTLDLNKDGTLSQNALDTLKQHGFNVKPGNEVVEGPPKVSHETVTSKEFNQNHPDMKKVQVVGFMDQDTPRVFDQNEEGGQYELTSDGGVKLSVNMTSHGSFHGGQHIDYHEAARTGHLVATISSGRDTPAEAFVVTFNPDGSVNLPPGTDARSLFDEHGNFMGGYIHYAVEDGTNPDGSVRIISLATDVGKNADHFEQTVSTPTYTEVQTYTVTPDQTPTSFTPTIDKDHHDMPPIIPIPIVTKRRLGEGQTEEDDDTTAPAAVTPPVGGPGGPNNGGPTPVTPPQGGPTTPGGPGGARRPGGRGPATPPGGGPGGPGRTGRRRPGTGIPAGVPAGAPTPGPGGPNTGPEAGAPGTGPATGPTTPPSPGPTTLPSPGPTAGGNPGPTPNDDTDGGDQTAPQTPPPATDDDDQAQTPPQTDQTAPDDDADDQQPQTPPVDNPYGKTRGEEIIDQVEAETRDMPPGITINTTGLSPNEVKMAVRLAYEIRNLVARNPDESYEEWRAKLRMALQDTGNLITNTLKSFPPEARSLFAAAADKLTNAGVTQDAMPEGEENNGDAATDDNVDDNTINGSVI